MPPFSRDFVNRIDGAAHHLATAARVNCEQRDSEFSRRACGAGDLMWYVVEFEVEENFRIAGDDVSDDLRARRTVKSVEPILNMPATL